MGLRTDDTNTVTLLIDSQNLYILHNTVITVTTHEMRFNTRKTVIHKKVITDETRFNTRKTVFTLSTSQFGRKPSEQERMIRLMVTQDAIHTLPKIHSLSQIIGSCHDPSSLDMTINWNDCI